MTVVAERLCVATPQPAALRVLAPPHKSTHERDDLTGRGSRFPKHRCDRPCLEALALSGMQARQMLDEVCRWKTLRRARRSQQLCVLWRLIVNHPLRG